MFASHLVRLMKYIFLLAFSMTFIACIDKKTTASEGTPLRIADANWLMGTWSNSVKDRRDFEAWKKYDDSTYIGRSYSIVGVDTVSSETIQLEERNGEVLYIPTVQGQNDNQPVSFRLTLSEPGKIVFENADHDFPQKITYQLVSSDSIVAEISGLIDGKHRAQVFPMKRTQ